MLAPDAVARLFFADREADFRPLLYEVGDERGGAHDRTLEARGGVRALARDVRDFARGDERVERDVDSPLVLGVELADDEAARTRRRLPVNVAHVVVRLILAQRVQVVSRAAPLRFELPRVNRQKMKLVARAQGLRRPL